MNYESERYIAYAVDEISTCLKHITKTITITITKTTTTTTITILTIVVTIIALPRHICTDFVLCKYKEQNTQT